MLTDLHIRKLAAKEASYKISDGRGLHLRVSSNGGKSWFVSYRLNGKQFSKPIGVYPEISLSDAREKLIELKKQLREGIDPSLKAGEGETFSKIAAEYLERKSLLGLAPRTMEKNKWLCKQAVEYLGDRPLRKITPSEIWNALHKIELSGRRETAHKTRGFIGEVYRFAIRTSRAEGDPTTASKGALMKTKVKHLPAITDPKKFGNLLASLEDFDCWPTIKLSMQFSALVFARPVEIRFARWAEIENDVWKIPDERMKGRRPHDVPLSKQAKEVLERAKVFGDGGLIFPGLRTRKRPLSENTLNVTLRRMGFSSEEHCAHGFRSSASTMLNSMGFVKDVIETQLSHLDENEVRRAYNRSQYWPERVSMMQQWADYLDELKRGSVV